MIVIYQWRGDFTNQEVNVLHAEAFGTRVFDEAEWNWPHPMQLIQVHKLRSARSSAGPLGPPTAEGTRLCGGAYRGPEAANRLGTAARTAYFPLAAISLLRWKEWDGHGVRPRVDQENRALTAPQ
jgi:hypothetical protein